MEDARAGEAGEGFSIVAEEVRTLASRSSAEAGKAREIMDQGEQQLDRSNRLQQDFQARMMELLQASIGARFSEVASSSEALGEEIPALTESSKKLAAELEGIMASIPEIDPASHSNAEVSESAMVATEELDGQAKELRCMVANAESRVEQAGSARAIGTSHCQCRSSPASIESLVL